MKLALSSLRCTGFCHPFQTFTRGSFLLNFGTTQKRSCFVCTIVLYLQCSPINFIGVNVTIKPLKHNGEACYAILFAYDVYVKELVKQLQNVRYTATHKCFYVFTKDWNLNELELALSNKGITISKSPTSPKKSVINPLCCGKEKWFLQLNIVTLVNGN